MLALTSNEGAFDFQTLTVDETRGEAEQSGLKNYMSLETQNLGKIAKTLYVVGATKAEYFTEVRKIVPNSFISA
jgi:orotidine-5'-phosphate decarboxylase